MLLMPLNSLSSIYPNNSIAQQLNIKIKISMRAKTYFILWKDPKIECNKGLKPENTFQYLITGQNLIILKGVKFKSP